MSVEKLRKILNERDDVLRRRIKDRLNDILDQKINKVYHDSIPLDRISEILREENVVKLDDQRREWEGILAGREGRETFMLAYGDMEEDGVYVPFTNAELVLSWHQMESTGRFEVTVYVS